MPSSSQPVHSHRPSLLPDFLGFGLALLLIGLGSAAMFWVTPVNPPPSSVAQPAPTPAEPEPVPSSPPVPVVPTPPAAPTSSTLTLEVRQNIYKLLSSEEDKTIRAANARFPGGGTEFQQYLDTQTQAYQKRIATDNSTTPEVVEGISLEGLTQGWNTQ